MIICIFIVEFEKIGILISILTPMILLIWFYYSQKQTLSKNYYREINGIYAGFTKPIHKPLNNTGVNSGRTNIMNKQTV